MKNKCLVTFILLDLLGYPIKNARYQVKNGNHLIAEGVANSKGAIVDISSFFIAVTLGQYVAYQKMQLTVSCNKIIPIIVLVVLCLCFFVFTFFPPYIGLFKDPVSGMFGI